MALLFHNKGLIDPVAIKTFGVSAKESSNPIGYFGTGLKYGIAVALRENAYIQLLRGTDYHSFSVRDTEMRGKGFKHVYMDDDPLPFTDELGKNWEPWMAYREFYCNAVDEGGGVKCVPDSSLPEELKRLEAGGDNTVFAITGFDDYYMRHEEFFWRPRNGDAPLANDKGYYRNGSGQYVFFKGVRVGEAPQPFMFDYNFSSGLTLTEDRTCNIYCVKTLIGQLVSQSTDEFWIEKVLTAQQGYFENGVDCHWHGTPTPAFMSVLERLAREFHPRLNRTALKYLPHEGLFLPKESVALSSREAHQLHQSKTLLTAMGYPMNKYPIIIAQSLGQAVMGRAKSGKIYLSKLCFDKGTTYVASTLLEEFIHLETGMKDETYEMQTHLFDLVIRFGEQATGKFL